MNERACSLQFYTSIEQTVLSSQIYCTPHSSPLSTAFLLLFFFMLLTTSQFQRIFICVYLDRAASHCHHPFLKTHFHSLKRHLPTPQDKVFTQNIVCLSPGEDMHFILSKAIYIQTINKGKGSQLYVGAR